MASCLICHVADVKLYVEPDTRDRVFCGVDCQTIYHASLIRGKRLRDYDESDNTLTMDQLFAYTPLALSEIMERNTAYKQMVQNAPDGLIESYLRKNKNMLNNNFGNRQVLSARSLNLMTEYWLDAIVKYKVVSLDRLGYATLPRVAINLPRTLPAFMRIAALQGITEEQRLRALIFVAPAIGERYAANILTPEHAELYRRTASFASTFALFTSGQLDVLSEHERLRLLYERAASEGISKIAVITSIIESGHEFSGSNLDLQLAPTELANLVKATSKSRHVDIDMRVLEMIETHMDDPDIFAIFLVYLALTAQPDARFYQSLAPGTGNQEVINIVTRIVIAASGNNDKWLSMAKIIARNFFSTTDDTVKEIQTELAQLLIRFFHWPSEREIIFEHLEFDSAILYISAYRFPHASRAEKGAFLDLIVTRSANVSALFLVPGIDKQELLEMLFTAAANAEQQQGGLKNTIDSELREYYIYTALKTDIDIRPIMITVSLFDAPKTFAALEEAKHMLETQTKNDLLRSMEYVAISGFGYDLRRLFDSLKKAQ